MKETEHGRRPRNFHADRAARLRATLEAIRDMLANSTTKDTLPIVRDLVLGSLARDDAERAS
jgi:hypothetical protein